MCTPMKNTYMIASAALVTFAALGFISLALFAVVIILALAILLMVQVNTQQWVKAG
ncbi:hypothetical protein LJB77_00160 [Ruminococcaceae bacterium OttesenSCG-928-N02]|nr:hypothetical protein [Ruminococcaceae bacterium OttesenSCG-928-N02]